jgi:hypothetical protein
VLGGHFQCRCSQAGTDEGGDVYFLAPPQPVRHGDVFGDDASEVVRERGGMCGLEGKGMHEAGPEPGGHVDGKRGEPDEGVAKIEQDGAEGHPVNVASAPPKARPVRRCRLRSDVM